MVWWNPLTWGDDAEDDSAEARAKRHQDVLFDTTAASAPIEMDPVQQGSAPYYNQADNRWGMPDNPGWTVSNPDTSWERWERYQDIDYNKPAFDPTFADQRAYQYGRTPGGADAAVNRAYGVGDRAQAHSSLQAEVARQRSGYMMNRDAVKGDWSQQNSQLQDASRYADGLVGLEATQGPSAAQAQLQAGTNQALGSQVAMARSGRGFGGGAAASGLATSNLAGIQANQANSAATLRAQEDAAWRSRQASNIAAGAGIKGAVGSQYGAQSQADLNAYYTNQAQNDAAAIGWYGAGNDAYFKGVGAELAAQGQATGVRGQEMQGGIALEDAKLRAWAAQNGYDLTQQQMANQESAANTAAGATVLSGMLTASDIRAKKNIAPADGAGSDFARDLSFDGTLYRPRDMGRFDPGSREPSPGRAEYMRGVTQPTAMQEQYLGAEAQAEPAQMSPTFERPELKAPDTEALDAASLDAVRNAPASFYDYKDPGSPGANDQRNYGPMAQDLAKTPVGATAVVEQPDGQLGVDTGRLALVNTGALAEQQRQLDAITAELEAFKRKPGADYPEYER